MKWLRWVLLGLVAGALVAFAAELLVPRRRRSSGYRSPQPASDNRAVLPEAPAPAAGG